MMAAAIAANESPGLRYWREYRQIFKWDVLVHVCNNIKKNMFWGSSKEKKSLKAEILVLQKTMLSQPS
jgi:hypothetical protein